MRHRATYGLATGYVRPHNPFKRFYLVALGPSEYQTLPMQIPKEGHISQRMLLDENSEPPIKNLICEIRKSLTSNNGMYI